MVREGKSPSMLFSNELEKKYCCCSSSVPRGTFLALLQFLEANGQTFLQHCQQNAEGLISEVFKNENCRKLQETLKTCPNCCKVAEIPPQENGQEGSGKQGGKHLQKKLSFCSVWIWGGGDSRHEPFIRTKSGTQEVQSFLRASRARSEPSFQGGHTQTPACTSTCGKVWQGGGGWGDRG